MTARQPPHPAPPTATAGRRRGRRIAATISGTILVACNLVTLFFTVVAYLMAPSGVGDTNFIDGAFFVAFFSSFAAVGTAVLTLIPVAARWLRLRWLLLPAAIFVLATAWWVYIGTAYPEPDQNALLTLR